MMNLQDDEETINEVYEWKYDRWTMNRWIVDDEFMYNEFDDRFRTFEWKTLSTKLHNLYTVYSTFVVYSLNCSKRLWPTWIQ